MGFFQWDRASPHARGDHGFGEAGAFFVGPVDYSYRVCGLDPVIVQGAEHLDASGDSKDAIVTSSAGLRIEVTASAGSGTIIEARSDCELVTHGICGDFAAERFCCCGEPVASLFVCV